MEPGSSSANGTYDPYFSNYQTFKNFNIRLSTKLGRIKCIKYGLKYGDLFYLKIESLHVIQTEFQSSISSRRV